MPLSAPGGNLKVSAIDNTYGGDGAGTSLTGDFATIIGAGSGDNISGDGATIFGAGAAIAGISAPNIVIFGRAAGADLTSGPQNTLIGYKSGSKLTTENDNVFVGFQAGELATVADCVFIGSNAGNAALADGVIGIGTDTLPNITAAGIENIAIGHQALASLTTGYNNLAIGYRAGFSNVIRRNNLFVGNYAGENASALLAVANTIVGNKAGRYITDGNNAILGNLAGQGETTSNGTMSESVAVGFRAMGNPGSNVIADRCVAVGADALRKGGNADNTCVGNSAGTLLLRSNNTNARRNVLIGSLAGANMSTGNENVCVGYNAGNLINTAQYNAILGDVAGTTLTSGDRNTFIGTSSGYLITTGGYNVMVGNQVNGANQSDSVSLGNLVPMLGSDTLAISNRTRNTAGQTVLISGNFADSNIGFNSIEYGSGKGLLSLTNAITLPTVNHTAGGYLFADTGALKWRGSAGTVTTIAAA